MLFLTSRKRILFGLLFALFVLSGSLLVAFREKLLIHILKKNLSRIFPAATFRVEAVALGPGVLELKNVTLKNAAPGPAFTISSARLRLKFSLPLFFKNKLLAAQEAFVSVDKVQCENLTFEHVTAALLPALDNVRRLGVIRIKALSYNDIRAADVSARVLWTKEALHLDSRDISFLGGQVSGQAEVLLNKQLPVVSATASVQAVDLSEIIRVLRLEKRFQATGAFDGGLRLEVKNGVLESVQGSLHSSRGGEFVLTDNSFKSQELLKFKGSNILVENLENYHYDIGGITIVGEGREVGLNINLEGKSGKRNFKIFWHRVEDKERKP